MRLRASAIEVDRRRAISVFSASRSPQHRSRRLAHSNSPYQPVVKVPTAFDRRCIPAGCVARRSNMPDILTPCALPSGRIAGLGARRDFHHGLLCDSARSPRPHSADHPDLTAHMMPTQILARADSRTREHIEDDRSPHQIGPQPRDPLDAIPSHSLAVRRRARSWPAAANAGCCCGGGRRCAGRSAASCSDSLRSIGGCLTSSST